MSAKPTIIKSHRTVRCVAGLSGVPSGRRVATIGSNGRLTWQAPDSEKCPHRTVRCARRQKVAAFFATARSVGEAINRPQQTIWRCGSPRNIPRHIVDNSQVHQHFVDSLQIIFLSLFCVILSKLCRVTVISI
jgi:hypothetical protein